MLFGFKWNIFEFTVLLKSTYLPCIKHSILLSEFYWSDCINNAYLHSYMHFLFKSELILPSGFCILFFVLK